jgi:hypothetical protein
MEAGFYCAATEEAAGEKSVLWRGDSLDARDWKRVFPGAPDA